MKPAARILSESDYPRWTHFVRHAPGGTIYSSPEYLQALCRAAGGSFRVAAVEQDGTILGGVALYEVRRKWGVTVSPRSLLHYNGLAIDASKSGYPSERISHDLAVQSALLEIIERQKYASVALKSLWTYVDARPFLAAGWQARPAYTAVADLTEIAALWSQVDRNLRRLVRRAEQQGLVFSEDSDFDSLYELHLQTHLRKGAPLYLPHKHFRRFVEELLGARLARLFHARLPDGRSAASQLVLAGPHEISHTVCAGADPDLLSTGANPFLRWKAFEALALAGYTANDLTNMGLDSVARFKSQLGGHLNQVMVLEAPRSRAAVAGTFVESAMQAIRTALRAPRLAREKSDR